MCDAEKRIHQFKMKRLTAQDKISQGNSLTTETDSVALESDMPDASLLSHLESQVEQ